MSEPVTAGQAPATSTVRKAVIPAAGRGTRFLPATKAVPKELLPLGDRPILHWIVEEAVAAGVEEIVLVISDDKEPIRHYFTVDDELNALLASRGKLDLLAPLNDLLERVTFTFVHQDRPLGLGHAVGCAAEAVGNEPALVLLGDAPIKAETPVCRQLVDIFATEGGPSVLGLRRVPREWTSRYGIVAGEARRQGVYKLADMVEKPEPAEAPSDLAIAGRYLLTPAIFELLATQTPGKGNEIQLTDAIARLMHQEPVFGLVYEGTRYDVGHPAGYREALAAFVA